MNIKGKHILDADSDTIWPMLQDEEVLARISPGVSRIERIGEDQFKAISDISIGPVRGSFEGELALTNKVVNETMTLTLSQKSKIGNAQAEIVMNLAPHEDGKTEVSYNGSAKVSGRLATMGQRILGGVISTLSKQVFKELEKVIDERKVAVVAPKAEATAAAKETISKQKAVLSQGKVKLEGRVVTEKSSDTIVHQEPPEIRKSFIQKIIDTISSLWR